MFQSGLMDGCVANTKDRRELFPLRPVWCPSLPRRRWGDALNVLTVLFENRENQNKKIEPLLFNTEHIRVA